MKLTLTPIRRDEDLTAIVSGDTITLNGEMFDFSFMSEGDTLPRDAVSCGWLASDVTREGGEIAMTLLLPHGGNAPDETRFPNPAARTVGDGPVSLPPYDIPSETSEELPQ